MERNTPSITCSRDSALSSGMAKERLIRATRRSFGRAESRAAVRVRAAGSARLRGRKRSKAKRARVARYSRCCRAGFDCFAKSIS